MGKDEERVPGRLRRTLKTAWLSSRVGTSYLGGRVTDAFRDQGARARAQAERHLDNARDVARTMGELRGPMMKIGQLLSTHAEAMPGEYGDLLRSLQSSAPPMAFETIRKVIEEDLGEDLGAIFTDFDEEAVAAASLGQVHRARLADGTEVAVKVQYPGAVDSVEGDLKNVRAGTTLIKRLLADTLGNTRFDLTPMAEELAEHLLQETDYCREAFNAKLLGRLFEGDPEIVIPKVHDIASGLKVITYDWLEGEDLDFGLRHVDESVRRRTIEQLQHAFWHQFIRGGLLHADPHPGNFKILGDGRLGILDHGCVKIFDEPFLYAFAEMMHASLEEDDARLRDAFVRLELMDDPESDAEFEDMQKIAGYFSIGMRSDAVFDFTELDYVASARELVTHFLSRRRVPPAQRHFLFLTRVVLGYYEYFSRARVPMNFHRFVMPYVEGGFRGRMIEIPPYG